MTWLDRQPPESIWTTAVTVLEIRLGLELLPAGQGRRRLEVAFVAALADDLEGRVLPFDESAAHEAGVLAARSRHFESFGVSLVDPWTA